MAESQGISTEDAAAIIGVKISRVQQLCRAWIASEGEEGLRCERVGKGRHAVYIITRADAEDYATRERKPGWPKGRKRASGYDTGPAGGRAVSTDAVPA